jgi:bifunctional NMN adenylyltransferase/nudix hydrolase
MHEFGVFIGRFQPFHNAHFEAVKFALTKVKKLIVVLGSASQAKTIKNPWSSDERIMMILSCFSDEERQRFDFVTAKDYLYNDNLWLTAVQEEISELTEGEKDIVLIGHRKDRSSFYLSLFPQWEFIETGDLHRGIDATRVRNLYFSCDLVGIKHLVPQPVHEILKHDMMEDSTHPRAEFIKLKEEFQHISEYKEMWKSAPFPPTFVTVDAVVIKSGHVLVVRRKGHPGKGLIALPGGFVNHNELIIDSCLRELKEETSIKLSREELLASLRDQRVFDHPNRSLRGRTITHAYCFNLGHGPLPKVKGDDDADKAWFMPLRDVFAKEESFFEDHFHVISHFAHKF